MGAGSGGADAVRMINRAARQARAYRAERRARREGIGLIRGEEAGELHTCSTCGGTFDVNFMLRDHDAWTCEACDFAAEADSTLDSAAEHSFWPAVGAALGLVSLFALEVVALEAGAGVFWLAWCSLVVSVAGLMATWAHGLRRAGVVQPALVVLELASAATAAVYMLRGVLTLV